MLIIDCCVRENESDTRKYYEAYLKKRHIENPDILYISRLGLKSLDNETLKFRDKLISKKNFDDDIFKFANIFKKADEILIAAPFWDLSFPSALKVFFEHICVSGLTFGYTDAGSVGFCKAERMLYFSTCGGVYGERHLGFEYSKSLMNMLGIKNSELFCIEGLDIIPEKRNELVEKAINLL